MYILGNNKDNELDGGHCVNGCSKLRLVAGFLVCIQLQFQCIYFISRIGLS